MSDQETEISQIVKLMEEAAAQHAQELGRHMERLRVMEVGPGDDDPCADLVGGVPPIRIIRRILGDKEKVAAPKDVRSRGIKMKGNDLLYSDEAGDIGVWVYGKAMSEKFSYFEVLILQTAEESKMVLGLVPISHPLNTPPGHEGHSIGYHGDKGRPYTQGKAGEWFGPKFTDKDIVGCGIRFVSNNSPESKAEVFFTKNGSEIGHSEVIVPSGGLFPAVSLHGEKERCRVDLKAEFVRLDTDVTRVPTTLSDWARLREIRLRDGHLEYCGQGSMVKDKDHGLAQASVPLSRRCHYFEIQIVHPGRKCCIAIGVAHKKYPENKHPGWVKGSVAYHADDGKIFTGIGRGKPLGPSCSKGDIMGCGILFPRENDKEQVSGAGPEKNNQRRPLTDMMSDTSGSDSDSDSGEQSDSSDSDPTLDDSEDETWWERENFQKRPVVEVFFTKNGSILGKKQVRIPPGGFFPTIGMMSSNERVLVDLQPLTG